MKKTAILAITAATMLTTSIGFAAPLTDYSAGKTAIDLTMRNSDVSTKTSDGDTSFGKKSNLDFGVTTGLGNNFAFQYNNYNAKSKDTVMHSDPTETDSVKLGLKTQQFNVLYKLNDNVSAFAGLVKVTGTVDINQIIGGASTSTSRSANKNKVQFGFVGSTKLADKTTAYASVGVASGFTDYKIGVSQEIAKNLEFNVDYRKIEAKKLSIDDNGANLDVTAKGLGFGVSYKF